MPSRQPVPTLDETSKRIIEVLQEDGRTSYAALGKVVGVSEAAIRQRMQRLLDHGVMQIVAVTDPRQVGITRQATIGIRTAGDSRVVADLLAELPEIEGVVVTTGSFDVLVQASCEDDEELLELVGARIRATPGVVGTETFVHLGVRKHRHLRPAR